MNAAKKVIDRIWDAHVVAVLGNNRFLLHVDRILLHERTGPALLAGLAAAGRWDSIRWNLMLRYIDDKIVLRHIRPAVASSCHGVMFGGHNIAVAEPTWAPSSPPGRPAACSAR